MLRAHTARCVPCAQFQSEAVAITHKLRLAPLEPLPAPIALPPRRRVVGPAAAGRCRCRRRGARRRDRGAALDLAAAVEPHRARRAAHRGAALGRLPRRAPGPAAAPAARVPVAHRARSGPHRHLTSGRAPGRSPPGRLSAAIAVAAAVRRRSGTRRPLDPRHLLRDGSRAVQRRRALGAAVEQRVLPAPPARPEDVAELEHELQRRPLARRGGRCDREGRRERHRGARLVRRRRGGASTRRARRLAAQPELQRSPARQARRPRNVVEWRAPGAGPTVAVGKKAVCTAPVRSEELNAKIALPVARVLKLARGAQLRIAVGSAKPATGNYRPRAYCLAHREAVRRLPLVRRVRGHAPVERDDHRHAPLTPRAQT